MSTSISGKNAALSRAEQIKRINRTTNRLRYKQDLLTDDVEYVMPLRLNVKHDQLDRSVTSPGEEVCWFDEGKSTLAKRVQQIRTGEVFFLGVGSQVSADRKQSMLNFWSMYIWL